MSYKLDTQNLAEMLRAYRRREGLSLRELADKMQMSPATLSRIENQVGKSFPDTIVLVELMNVCGFTPDEIFQSDDEAGKANLQDISIQLRASKQISSATMEALEAVIRAVRSQLASEQIS